MATKFYSKRLSIKHEGRNYQVNVFTSQDGVHVHIHSMRRRPEFAGTSLEMVEQSFVDPEGQLAKKILATEDVAAFVRKWTSALARVAA